MGKEIAVEKALASLRERIEKKRQQRDAFEKEHATPYVVQVVIREAHDLRGKTSAHMTSIYSKLLQRAILQQLSEDIKELEEKIRIGERDKHLPGTVAFLYGRAAFTRA